MKKPEVTVRHRLRRGRMSVCLRSCLTLLALGGVLAPSYGAQAPKLPPLTTVSGNPRLPGKFIWADLVTDDVPRAQKFYAQLFGWRFRYAGNYAIAVNDGRPVAGIFQVERPKDRPEAKPRWFGYISVKSVERAQQAVIQAGGRVAAPAKEMPDRGEQAVFADPEGALFGVIKSKSGDPEDFLPDLGDWIWIQLLSHDGSKAAEFYRSVAGYEVVANSTPNGLSDYVLTSKGYARATVRTIRQNPTNVQPTWLPFVRVQSVEQSAAQVEALGGKVLLAPKPEVFEGKLAILVDPTGAEIGVLEWTDKISAGGPKP